MKFWIFLWESPYVASEVMFNKLPRHQFISLDRDSDRSVFVSDTIPHSLLQTPDKKLARQKSHQIAPEKPLCGRKTALWWSEREWEEPGWRGGREKVLYEEVMKKVLYGTSSFLKPTKEDDLGKLSVRISKSCIIENICLSTGTNFRSFVQICWTPYFVKQFKDTKGPPKGPNQLTGSQFAAWKGDQTAIWVCQQIYWSNFEQRQT